MRTLKEVMQELRTVTPPSKFWNNRLFDAGDTCRNDQAKAEKLHDEAIDILIARDEANTARGMDDDLAYQIHTDACNKVDAAYERAVKKAKVRAMRFTECLLRPECAKVHLFDMGYTYAY